MSTNSFNIGDALEQEVKLLQQALCQAKQPVIPDTFYQRVDALKKRTHAIRQEAEHKLAVYTALTVQLDTAIKQYEDTVQKMRQCEQEYGQITTELTAYLRASAQQGPEGP